MGMIGTVYNKRDYPKACSTYFSHTISFSWFLKNFEQHGENKIVRIDKKRVMTKVLIDKQHDFILIIWILINDYIIKQ